MMPAFFHRTYNSSILHWICLLFIVGHVTLTQYGFAITDHVPAPDHDYDILAAAGFMGNEATFSQNPASYVRSAFRNVFSFRGEKRGYTPQMLILAVCFIVFGKTLFVYKMSMVWALLGTALGVYYFLYRQTRSELASMSGTLLTLVVYNIVKMAGLYFGFLPLGCVMIWTLSVYVSLCRQLKWPSFIIFAIFFYLATRIHYSGYLYFGILGSFLLLRSNTRRFAVLFAVVFGLVFYGDMNIMPRWFYSFMNSFNGGLSLTPLAVGGWHEFYRGSLFCFRGLKWQSGPVIYHVFAAVLLVYVFFHRKYMRDRSDERREIDGVIVLLLFCMGAILSVMLMSSGVVAGNFIMFYVAEALLLTLMLWDMSRYTPKWVGACFMGLLIGMVLSQQGVYSNRYDRVRKYWGRGEKLDLAQLMHYIQTEQNTSKRESTVCLVAGTEPGSGGHCAKMYDLKKNISCLDSRAFYHSMRVSWVILNPHAGLASQKAMRDLVDNDLDRGAEAYDYLFVFVGDDRLGMDDTQGRSRCFEKYLKQNGNPSDGNIGRLYRPLVHYPIDMGMTLTVYRNRKLSKHA